MFFAFSRTPGVAALIGLAACGLAATGTALAATPPAGLAGAYVLHLHIGERHFKDELVLRQGDDGRLAGTLTVPGNFSAPLEKVEAGADALAFEILATEGPQPFRVRFEARVHAATRTLVGFATLADGELMGGFVAKPLAP